jgi:hypothetical protein
MRGLRNEAKASRTTSRTQVRLAVLAGAFWLLGFDVFPLAHMLLHDVLEQHHHGHEHGHAHADDAEEPPPAEHGEGSVAHRDLAANVPLPTVPAVREALLTRFGVSSFPYAELAADRQPRTSRARAPPSVTA